MPSAFTSTSTGKTIVTNGIDPAMVFQGGSGPLANAGVAFPTTAVTGGGSGVGSLEGTYFAYVTFVRSDGLESSLSPISGNFILTDNLQVNYSNLPLSTDPRVTARRIYRNTGGQVRTVYLDVEVANNIDTTATSTLTDSILQVRTAFPLFTDENLPRAFDNNPPPDTKPFTAWHQDRMYYYGWEDYTEGSCEVTLGLPQVIGVGTAWKANWAGRLLYVAGAPTPYEIASVDEAAQIITLTESYLGDTNLFAGYTVRPTPGECLAFYWSKLGEPEQVSPLDAGSIPEEGDVPTGLYGMRSFLYFLKRRTIYRWTCSTDPRQDGQIFPSTRRGVVNSRCVAVIDEMSYAMDERGVYKFQGGRDTQEVSVAIQDMFRDGTDTPINWQASRYFFAAASPGESVVRWFVCFRGDFRPRHALCYCYTLERWWVEQYQRPVGAASLGQVGGGAGAWSRGTEQPYLGMDAGEIAAQTHGNPDLLQAERSMNALVESGGIETVTLAMAPGSAAGVPLVLRKTSSGVLQTRTVTKVVGAVVTVSPPWLVWPAEGDEVVLGGFPWQYQSRSFEYVRSEATGERKLVLMFGTNKGSKVDVVIAEDCEGDLVSAADISAAANFGVEAVDGRAGQRVDMGKRPGQAVIAFDGLRETSTDGDTEVHVAMTGVGGNSVDLVHRLTLKGVS